MSWIRPEVAREVEHWRQRAASIPDAATRRHALTALSSKRFNAEGAALFAVLAPRRDATLLRLLVAFQVLLDFLDSLSERPTADAQADGMQLHLALRDALDPDGPISDYFRHRPFLQDGGYVRALVQACRESCLYLPSYASTRSLVLRGAVRCGVQGLNHDTDPVRRDRSLQAWAGGAFHNGWGLSWWELTAAASSTLGIHALLALAADPACEERDAVEVDAAYMPWICAASTMLDSYVDEVADAAESAHSYIAHYPSEEIALARTRELVHRSLEEARRLQGGACHALIVAGMVAMYLSAEEARTVAKRNTTQTLVRTGGSLTRASVPILRMWRTAYGLRRA
jgi:tetraprenyl-beta-curcumene synthase